MPWQVGDYETVGEKPFAYGSFGIVWNGRRMSDGTRVALKLVLNNVPDGRERVAAERHGAMLQQRFEQAHGMVPKVYDYGQVDDDFYIAMEFVEGGSIGAVIREGALPPNVAASHAGWVCGFLEKAHQFATTIEGVEYERVVHADLKPEHVLISPANEMKVLDFGIAKALAKTTPVTTDNWGTTPYASPERLRTGHVNEDVDFWSLGVMLYEMVSGHLPYPQLAQRHQRSQLEEAIRTNAPREPLPPSCPQGLSAIVNKLLANQPERRYATAAAIRSDLERFLSGAEPVAVREFVTPPTLPIRPATSARPPQPAAQFVPPTEPLPIGAPAAAAPAVPAVTARTRPGRTRYVLRRLAWAVILFVFIGIVASRGAAFVAAEHFRNSIDALDGRTLSDRKQDYDNIRWGLVDPSLRARVKRPLQERLVGLADVVIADYRREDPTMGASEWRQANAALQWAAELSPNDTEILAKKLNTEGHLARIAARAQPRGTQAIRHAYQAAVDKFRTSADLDKTSFDPYLAISRIAIYALDDVDAGVAAIQEAQKRGYASGRRELAQLGDGYLRRANISRKLARALSGDQRRREQEKARADYGRCVDSFDTIVGFANAAQNLETCKKNLEALAREISAEPGDTELQE
ncbi:MAG: serine/threonine-protein kinase [Acidobacteriota bacterium]